MASPVLPLVAVAAIAYIALSKGKGGKATTGTPATTTGYTWQSVPATTSGLAGGFPIPAAVIDATLASNPNASVSFLAMSSPSQSDPQGHVKLASILGMVIGTGKSADGSRYLDVKVAASQGYGNQVTGLPPVGAIFRIKDADIVAISMAPVSVPVQPLGYSPPAVAGWAYGGGAVGRGGGGHGGRAPAYGHAFPNGQVWPWPGMPMPRMV